MMTRDEVDCWQTSISREELSTRLSKMCDIIREEVPGQAAALLARMVVIWASPAGASTEGGHHER
jgi:hypothetical protein